MLFGGYSSALVYIGFKDIDITMRALYFSAGQMLGGADSFIFLNCFEQRVSWSG